MAAKGMRRAIDQEQELIADDKRKTAQERQGLIDAYLGVTPGQSARTGLDIAPDPSPDRLMTAMMGSENPRFQELGLVQAFTPPKEKPGFTLSPGQSRFNAAGQEIASMPESEEEDSGEMFDSAKKLRDEYTKRSKDFIDMRNSFNKILSASESGAGDVSLIFSFMKLIDPGSTVREGEFATAEQTAGVPTRIVNLYNKLIDGDRLGPTQRASFKNEAYQLFNSQRQTQLELERIYQNLSTQSGLDPSQVAIDMFGDKRDYEWTPVVVPDGEIPTVASQAEYDALPSGAEFMEDGKRYIKP